MKDINKIMDEMPVAWRFRWCKCSINFPCCCIGCANISGQLVKKGFTKSDWQEWVNCHSEVKNKD